MAEPVRIDCTLETSQRQKGWIPAEMVIVEDGDDIKIFDPISYYHNDGEPAEGDVVRDDASRLTVKWQVRSKDRRGQIVRMVYRAAYFKNDGTVSITASPLGYANGFASRGTCERKPLGG